MNKESVIDASFDVNITTSYFLSIQLQLDGFSFCVLDPVSNEYILFKQRPILLNENILEVLEFELAQNDLLVYPYQKIFVLYQTNKYTLIPQALYIPDKENTYSTFCFSQKEKNNSLSQTNKIKMADSVCIFDIPDEIHDLLSKYYNNIKYFCQVTPFIETALLSTSVNAQQNHVHINIQSSFFDVIVTSGNNLQLHNSFHYNDHKEFLYYVLFVFDQLKLDTRATKIFLSGKIDKTHELYLLLKKYVKQIEISNETKHFKFAHAFKNLSLQNHLNLFNIPLCV